MDLESLNTLVSVFRKLVEGDTSCSLKYISQNGKSKLLLIAETAVPTLCTREEKKKEKEKRPRPRADEKVQRQEEGRFGKPDPAEC